MKFFTRNSLLYIFLSLILLADLSYSYYQYSGSIIDGDFTAIVMSDQEGHPYQMVLKDPIGWAAFNGAVYSAPNRFTAHWLMSLYYKQAPLLMQPFLSPIDSLYTCIAITKFLIHIGLLFLLSYYASSWNGFKWKSLLIAAVLLSALFQAGPTYQEYMQLISIDATYPMFYPLPMIFVLLFFLPFYRYYVTGVISNSFLFISGWMAFIVCLVFFGPLPSPVLFISALMVFYFSISKHFWQNNTNESDPVKRLWKALRSINTTVAILLIFTALCSLYSIYVGTKNYENTWTPMPLEDRFAGLLKGIDEAFFMPEKGLSYILVFLCINLILLYITDRKKHYAFLKLTFFLAVFSLVYIVLLPFGGYRSYRAYILRWDTLMPVLCILYYSWAASSFILLSSLQKIKKWAFLIFIIPISIYYTSQDKIHTYNNLCEKEQMRNIAASKEQCVALLPTCKVMSWHFDKDCHGSQVRDNCVLMEHYNILPPLKRYYFPE